MRFALPPRLRHLIAALATAIVVASCGSPVQKTSGNTGSNGTSGAGGADPFGLGGEAGRGPPGVACTTDGDCGPGGLCDPGSHTCGCGGTQVMASVVPPNLLILMDRSCSMQKAINGTPKWTIAVQALTKLTQTYAGKIRFGLALFPDRIGIPCTQGAIPIPVGPGNEMAIQQLLMSSLTKGDTNYPNGPCVTPIDAAMTQAQTDPALTDKTRGDFALLITDGMQAGCNVQNGNMVTIQAITALLMGGASTFVVGFGAAASVASLDSFAQAGGEVNPAGPHKFYDAADQTSLDGALAAIARASLSCVLRLSQSPPNGDASLIYVYFDKKPPPVPRDPSHNSGWDYDAKANAVSFYGASCDALKQGKVSGAEVVFGCAGGPVPPPPI
jgi:hypothetical protein